MSIEELTPAEIAELEGRPITVDQLRSALAGGYLAATVRSKASNRHVTFSLACKKRGPDGRTLSRSTRDGRVGFAEADVVYIDADGEFTARLERGEARWIVGRSADRNVVWAAKALIAWGEGSRDLGEQADVMLKATCSVCHKGLRHPESIAERIGPECSGRRRRGRRAERVSINN